MQRHTEQEIEKGFLLFLRLVVAGAACFALLMQNRPTKFSVLFGVLKKRRYYATKRGNEVGKIQTLPWREIEKALEISVHFALCGVVGSEEKNTRHRVGKKIFSSVEGNSG